jgi:hypothetical protein
MPALLRISDGSTHVSLLGQVGIMLKEWKPARAPLRDGGVWHASPSMGGRVLTSYQYENAIESMTIAVVQRSQDELVRACQDLDRLLIKAMDFWAGWQPDPVWLEARGALETHTRYAPIYAYSLPNDDDPYGQPFYGSFCVIGMDELVLSIERGHWQAVPPSTGLTVPYDTLQPGIPITEVDAQVTASANDVEWHRVGDAPETLVDELVATRTSIAAGRRYYESYAAGLRFENIDIPKGATILAARLSLTASTDAGGASMPFTSLRIAAEAADSAPAWDTAADFQARARTTHVVTWTTWANLSEAVAARMPGITDEWESGKSMVSPDILDVVAEVINRPGWVAGNDLVLFLEPTTVDTRVIGDERRQFYAAEAADADLGARLSILWEPADTAPVGQDADANTHMLLANYTNDTRLTHVFRYDADALYGETFSDNLLEETLPYALTPDPIGSGDCIYFGASLISGGLPFYGVGLDLLVGTGIRPGEYLQMTLEVWTGTDWSIVRTDTGIWSLLNETGAQVLAGWHPDWVPNTVNGIEGYWMRCYFSVTHLQPTTPIQQHQHPFALLRGCAHLDADTILGDLPALASHRLRVGHVTTTQLVTDRRAIMGLRSAARGDDFNAFINFSDRHVPDGLTITRVSQDDTAYAVCTALPTGHALTWTPAEATDEKHLIQLEITGGLQTTYRGQYHAFLRALHADEYPDKDLRVRVTIGYQTGLSPVMDSGYAPVGSSLISDPMLIDLGTADLDLRQLTAYETPPPIVVNLYGATSEEADWPVLTLVDLVLIPTDEWAADTTLSMPPGDSFGTLHLDSVGNPRVSIRALGVQPNDLNTIQSTGVPIANGPAILQAHAAQYLWVLVACQRAYVNPGTESVGWCAPITYTQLRSVHAPRYLSMRGDR